MIWQSACLWPQNARERQSCCSPEQLRHGWGRATAEQLPPECLPGARHGRPGPRRRRPLAAVGVRVVGILAVSCVPVGQAVRVPVHRAVGVRVRLRPSGAAVDAAYRRLRAVSCDLLIRGNGRERRLPVRRAPAASAEASSIPVLDDSQRDKHGMRIDSILLHTCA